MIANADKMFNPGCPRYNRGSILIVGLWTLATLAALAVITRGRLSSELRFVNIQRERLKALYLAKAGIKALILEKQNDETTDADTFNESWSNKISADNTHVFKDFPLGYGEFTISYTFKEYKDSQETVFYGMMDEQSKFNINTVVDGTSRQQFVELLKQIITEGGQSKAEDLANALADWIDEDDSKLLGGLESDDYADLGYAPQNKPLSVIEELLLVKDFSPEILYGKDKNNDGVIDFTEKGIIEYITIYGDGTVNINTTTQEVLQSLINAEASGYDTLASEIFQRVNRKGIDNELGSSDDKAVTGLNEIVNLFSDDINKQGVINNLGQYITFFSDTFRIKSTGVVHNTSQDVEAVLELQQGIPPNFVYWSE